ncbi:MAG: hypothetical protein QM727_07900 [Niabella sp.]
MRQNIVFIALTVLLCGCGMFDYHPYDGKLKGRLYNNADNIAKIEKNTKGKTTLRFAFLSDTQGWYDDTEDAVKALNVRNDIDFVIHGAT